MYGLPYFERLLVVISPELIAMYLKDQYGLDVKAHVRRFQATDDPLIYHVAPTVSIGNKHNLAILSSSTMFVAGCCGYTKDYDISLAAGPEGFRGYLDMIAKDVVSHSLICNYVRPT